MSEALDKILLAAKTADPADAVREQAHDDYPKSATAWMKDLKWHWPQAVDMKDIDISNALSWAAEAEPKKLAKFEKKISQGQMKPSILVRPEGKGKYIVVDGHHRVLANMNLKRPVMAWTADTSQKKGPWDQMHDLQDHGNLKASGLTSLELIELAADSMQKASTLYPIGKKPLWKKTKPKPWHLPPYVQHVAHAMMAHGHSESEAIQIAIGVIKRWAAGKPAGGEKKLHKDTQAAAAKALAEWQNIKSAAHSTKK